MANSPVNRRLGRFVVTSGVGKPCASPRSRRPLGSPLERDGLALAALNGITTLLLNMELFLYVCVR